MFMFVIFYHTVCLSVKLEKKKKIYSAAIKFHFYILQKYQLSTLFIFLVSITPHNFITKY